MNFPHRRIDDMNPFDQDVARTIRLNEIWPQVITFSEHSILNRHTALAVIQQLANAGAGGSFASFFASGPSPPVLIRSRAIKCPAARDRNVLLLERVNKRRVVHALSAFEARVNNWQILFGIGAERERRAF